MVHVIEKIEMLLPVWILEGNLAHFRGKIRKRYDLEANGLAEEKWGIYFLQRLLQMSFF
ncbi:MAG: hypothetical protein F6K19_37445 [Cyanothece sp. SIO1E1]|nr:hypothetical protein [Cyanothece sp. SIO1E1]